MAVVWDFQDTMRNSAEANETGDQRDSEPFVVSIKRDVQENVVRMYATHSLVCVDPTKADL